MKLKQTNSIVQVGKNTLAKIVKKCNKYLIIFNNILIGLSIPLNAGKLQGKLNIDPNRVI